MAKQLVSLGFSLIATGGTQRFLEENNVPSERINKCAKAAQHRSDSLKDNKVALVII